MDAHKHSVHNGQLASLRKIVAGVADVARTMHAAGMHHQDFYLTHLMVPQSGAPRRSTCSIWAGSGSSRGWLAAGS